MGFGLACRSVRDDELTEALEFRQRLGSVEPSKMLARASSIMWEGMSVGQSVEELASPGRVGSDLLLDRSLFR